MLGNSDAECPRGLAEWVPFQRRKETTKQDMTATNLREAFAGESQVHMKYTIFAHAAEEAGYPEVACLFRAIAYAERVHATNHLRELGGYRRHGR